MFKSFITLSTILLLAVSVGFAADIPTGKVVAHFDVIHRQSAGGDIDVQWNRGCGDSGGRVQIDCR